MLRDFRALLFDLDGTLADTAPDLAAAANAMRVARGMAALPLERLRPMASAGARGLLHVAFEVGPEDADYLALRDEFLSRYQADLVVHSVLFDGVDAVLSALDARDFPWGIVTNKAARFTDPLCDRIGLATRAGAIVSGDTTPHAKPHPAPLLYAASLLQVDPEACVYVGDDHRDIVAGRAAGMQTIAAGWGYCGATAPATWGADALLEHPRDMIALLPGP